MTRNMAAQSEQMAEAKASEIDRLNVLAGVNVLREQLQEAQRYANTLQATIDRQGETSNSLRCELAKVQRANAELLWQQLLVTPRHDFSAIPAVATDVVETDDRAGAYSLAVVLGMGSSGAVREGVRDESAGGGRFAIKIVEKARVDDYDARRPRPERVPFPRDREPFPRNAGAGLPQRGDQLRARRCARERRQARRLLRDAGARLPRPRARRPRPLLAPHAERPLTRRPPHRG